VPIVRQPGAPAPYQQIREILRKEILETMSAGDRVPPERELAERFGANRATVSRALAALVSEGLLVRRAARGTFVAGGAGLARTRTRTVGLVVPDIEGPFPAGVIRAAVRELRRHSYKPVLLEYDDSVLTEAREVARLTEEGLDGALVITRGLPENWPAYDQLVRLGYPIVFLDHKPLDLEADCVATDHFRWAYEAVCTLIARGHSRIAHFTYMGGRTHSSIEERRQGYEQALTDNGIEVDPELVVPPVVYPHDYFVYKHVLSYLRQIVDPITAVFGLNDSYALSAIVACRETGASVPDEVEIASFFDGGFDPVSQMPPLIKVVQRQDEIARAGVELVMSRIEDAGPDGPQTIAVPADIVNELEAVQNGVSDFHARRGFTSAGTNHQVRA